jgi:protein-S-isoprenylcysteine O-methyltransferase Ste14
VFVRYSFYDLPFAVFWLAWLAYWIIAARNVKATRRRESPVSRLVTVVPTVSAAALLVFRGQPLHWLNARFLPQTVAVYWLGLLMTVLGLAFAVWARVHLGRNWSGTVTVKEDHELIRTGPYGLVRHPIYTGLLLAILGTAVAFGAWRGLLAFGFLTVAFLFKLRREERFMNESFPSDYPRYRAAVPALIPCIFGLHRTGLSP